MTTTIKKFDRRTCGIISAAIELALRRVAAEYGVAIRPGSGSFSEGSYTVKVEVSTLNADGTVNTPAAEAYRRYASVDGLPEDGLGRTFEARGETYTISGYLPRARKMPVLATRADGRTFKFAPAAVRRALAS
jgi:hypothetical protein